MEENKKQDSGLMLIWFVLWTSVGVFSLYLHNLVLPYIYAAYVLLLCTSHLYLACTRCPYFGLPCYLRGGLLSKKLFKARREGSLEPDDSILAAAWLILGVFPIPFLIYYRDWFWAVVFAALASGWFYSRKRFICRRCENDWCPNKK